MNVSFILTIDLDTVDPAGLEDASNEIADAVDTVFSVIDCKPWARPVTAPTLPALGTPVIPPFPSTGL